MMKKTFIISLACAALCGSCTKTGGDDWFCGETAVIVDSGGGMETKSRAFDENTIYDVNLWIYAPDGTLEEHQFRSSSRGYGPKAEIKCKLLRDREYGFFIIANAGESLGNMDIDRIRNFRFHMAYPDGNSRGMPMSGRSEGVIVRSGEPVTVNVERMLSKVNVKVDKSLLDEDVEFYVMGISVGNCPRCMNAFSPSRAADTGDFFPSGYRCEGTSAMSVYLMENRQTTLDKELCSYIEIDVDYNSPRYHTAPGKGIKYRFYLRENDGFNVRRNSIYNITVTPEADGLLCEDSWRLDKKALIPVDYRKYMVIEPAGTVVDGMYYPNYYEMGKGASMHFDLDFSPPDMNVHLREDLVTDEREEGRAIYEMDADCRGFTVTSLGRECVTMMEIIADEPLSDSETIVIAVN